MSETHLLRLVLMRHAKAAYPLGVADHDRPLAQRGHADAAVAGRWLLENSVIPDFILCSSALRARQSCTWVCQQLGDKAPTAKLEDRLYAASAGEMLAVVNNLPQTVRTLLVISHLPGIQDLGLRLASRDSDEAAYTNLAMSYPTSALAVFEYAGSWAGLDGQDARATAFAVPRAA
ncbi:histidine phosphatase family protein [Paeniglutamicibacter antarcticus]|uniref:Histidine phosphatase family protein n=1 Tax=Arthrobacter terrae TaxID=2935737 RepID=A0A931CSH1_9MICC|nr:histidine phosphatase family protein [Arthrobacter terrae]MBG0740094.1 histidine phosphatase family protein [Arthrobacter terrae]